MNEILCKQLALDFCCSEADIADSSNHFTVFTPLEGRRRYHVQDDCFLKIAALNGKLLFSGNEDIIGKCRELYESANGAWFFEAKELIKLDTLIGAYGYRIKHAHPFYISATPSSIDTSDYDIKWYVGDETERFRGDDRYKEAFGFCETAPDMLGVSASQNGVILGMAGASSDSPTMWQIGINVFPEARGNGIGTLLVALLKNRILEKGILPFYGTAMSHIVSQKVAHGAGFVPAWSELSTESTGAGK